MARTGGITCPYWAVETNKSVCLYRTRSGPTTAEACATTARRGTPDADSAGAAGPHYELSGTSTRPAADTDARGSDKASIVSIAGGSGHAMPRHAVPLQRTSVRGSVLRCREVFAWHRSQGTGREIVWVAAGRRLAQPKMFALTGIDRCQRP